MRKTSLFKRSMAGLLCFVLVLSLIPAMSWVAKAAEEGDSEGQNPAPAAANVPDGNFITLPITVRDFAADGMLFEYNEMGEKTFTTADTGDAKYDENDLFVNWTSTTTFTITDRIHNPSDSNYTAVYNPTDGSFDDESTGFFVLSYDFNVTIDSEYDHLYWYCLLIDDKGNILKVLPSGTPKTSFKTDINEYYTLPDGTSTQPYYSVWTWRDPQNLASYSLMDKVTEENKEQFGVGFYDSQATTAAEILADGNSLYFYLGIPYKSPATVPETNADGKYMGIYAWRGDEVPSGYTSYSGYWTRIICDRTTGRVITVVPAGTEGDDYGTSAYNVIMIRAADDPASLERFSHITDNMSEYQIAKPDCDGGGALFIERTITAHASDTKGFGLLYTLNTKDYRNWLDASNDADNLPNTKYYEYTTNTELTDSFYYHEMPYEVGLWDETPVGDPVAYGYQDLYGAGIRTNLVSKSLDDEGKPIYTETTVDFLANYMAMVMRVPEVESGAFNTNYVMGVKMFTGSVEEGFQYVDPMGSNAATAQYDLAEVLRAKVYAPNNYGEEGYKLGDYDTTKRKFESDGLRTYNDVETWYDAAYFLLHNTWRDSTGDNGSDGYGKPSNYQSMHLVQTTNANGDICYVFNAKYNNTTYNHADGVIYNSPFAETENAENRTYPFAYNYSGEAEKAYGVELPDKRFDPLGPSGAGQNLGYGMSGATYGDFGNLGRKEYYDTTNYNLTLEGHAEFVYRYESDLYFTFTGDDDVYLYINGFRVLDLGGAHGISKATININDVAEACKLQEGGTYSFDFFYMERHGTAANFGIETNIQLAESGMITTKNGYQNGTTTGYDAPVDPSKPVSYSFTLTNSGEATLENLIFEDAKLDVYLGYDDVRWGSKIEGANDLENGGPLKNMYVYKTDADGKTIQSWTGATLTDTKLREILAAGIGQGESITIYNLRYTITQTDWTAGGNTFTNIVNTTATDSSGKELHGTADWKVRKADVSVDPFRIYNWVDIPQGEVTWQYRDVKLTKAELIQPILDERNDLDTSKATIVLCNASGNTNRELWSEAYKNVVDNITWGTGDGFLTYNSKAPGMQTVYYKIEDIGYDELIYHFDVITYGTADNVYVLDYGLNVELNCNQYGFRLNDHLSIPQNIYEVGMTKTMDVRPNGVLQWGEFSVNARSLGIETSVEYQPKAIINGCDSMTVTFTFVEANADTTKDPKFYSVTMTQNVSTAPANVVYYEEDFPGITYVNGEEGTDGNQWVHYETMAPVMVQDTYENGELKWTQAVDENGKPIFEPAFDADGHPIYEQEVDENGTPVVDADGKPVYKQAKDDEGKVILDEAGKPVYVQAKVPVMLPVMIPLVENGKPVYESTAGTNQSPDQDSNYGSDPNYEEDKVGAWNGEVIGTTRMEVTEEMTADETQDTIIGNLNNSLGITGPGQASNGTVNALEIKKTDKVMYFDFKGTGFEIVSRTTANRYAIVMVFVDEVHTRKENGDPETWTTVRTLPVICESKGGDLYQVPIVSITGLEHGDYRVTVRGAAVAGQETKILYIDGIRIYGPLGEEAQRYYNPEEYGATFYEIKSLISDKDESTGLRTATYADVKMNDQGQIMYTDGTTVIEYTGNGYFMVEAADNVAEYISLGPNNEIYLSGQTTCSVIMVDLTPIEGYPEAARTIEVGAHRKVDSVWDSNGYAVLVYGSTPDAIYRQEFDATSLKENEYLVLSGTEQYYTIDVDNLELKDGKYFLMIGTNGCQGSEVLALTSLKIAGYTLSLPTGMPKNEGTPDTDEITEGQMFKALKGIYDLMKASAEEEVDTTPVNENLVISVADIMSSNVNYGKTASVSIVATAEADNVKVFAPDGTEVALSKLTRKVSGDTVSFLVQWKVTGDRGNGQIYTIRVYDENGNVSANTKTVTLNIR